MASSPSVPNGMASSGAANDYAGTGHNNAVTKFRNEAGQDGFWLATRSIERFVVHSTSVVVSREHRRAKTDRLDTEMLIRVFLGWLRGEPRHCKMVAIPTLEEEDARRPSRERESLIGERTNRIINRMKAALCIRGFKPELLKAHSALKRSKQRRACQSHQTCLMNCGAIWRDWLGSASRSMRSSRLGLNAWNRRRILPTNAEHSLKHVGIVGSK
jgi:hypothetical protein